MPKVFSVFSLLFRQSSAFVQTKQKTPKGLHLAFNCSIVSYEESAERLRLPIKIQPILCRFILLLFSEIVESECESISSMKNYGMKCRIRGENDVDNTSIRCQILITYAQHWQHRYMRKYFCIAVSPQHIYVFKIYSNFQMFIQSSGKLMMMAQIHKIIFQIWFGWCRRRGCFSFIHTHTHPSKQSGTRILYGQVAGSSSIEFVSNSNMQISVYILYIIEFVFF